MSPVAKLMLPIILSPFCARPMDFIPNIDASWLLSPYVYLCLENHEITDWTKLLQGDEITDWTKLLFYIYIPSLYKARSINTQVLDFKRYYRNESYIKSWSAWEELLFGL